MYAILGVVEDTRINKHIFYFQEQHAVVIRTWYSESEDLHLEA